MKEGSLREIKADLTSDVPRTKLLYVTPVSCTHTHTESSISPAVQEKLENGRFRALLAANKDKIGFFAVDEVKHRKIILSPFPRKFRKCIHTGPRDLLLGSSFPTGTSVHGRNP